jgi:peptidoglycan/LPS O-acetylase OafA/YrhL
VLFLVTWHSIDLLSLPRDVTTTTLFEWAFGWRFPLAVLAFFLATVSFSGIVAGNGTLCRFLNTRVLQYLGTISYSFYLWHPIFVSGFKVVMVRLGTALSRSCSCWHCRPR